MAAQKYVSVCSSPSLIAVLRILSWIVKTNKILLMLKRVCIYICDIWASKFCQMKQTNGVLQRNDKRKGAILSSSLWFWSWVWGSAHWIWRSTAVRYVIAPYNHRISLRLHFTTWKRDEDQEERDREEDWLVICKDLTKRKDRGSSFEALDFFLMFMFTWRRRRTRRIKRK